MMKDYFKKVIMFFIMVFSIAGINNVNAFASDDFEIGVFNLNKTTVNSAK